MGRKLSVRAIVVHEGKLLCVRLKPYEGAIAGDFWCTPGGGLGEGEALLDGLRREMIEETNIEPRIGNLLYIQQFMLGPDKECLEFFFQITNGEDYLHVDLAETTHGAIEIEEIAFVDPAATVILPAFLTTEALPASDAPAQPVKVFSFVG